MSKIVIGGDFATTGCGLQQIEKKRAFSLDVINCFRQSDFAILNLESPVAEETDKPIEKIGPNLYTKKEAILYLKESGVDMVTLANNHIYDFGISSFDKTIKYLKENEIDYVGTQLYRTKIIRTESESIAFLNYCENEFSTLNNTPASALDLITVFNDIKEAKSKNCLVIVIIHGGNEGYQLPTPRMKRWYRFFIDAGASVVVNHHQHCYSGYEKYEKGWIFYGLGNLFFDMNINTTLWHEGYLLQIQTECNRVIDVNLIPYEQCVDADKQVKLVHGEKKLLFRKKIEELNYLINNEQLLKETYDLFCSKQKKNMLAWFTPYTNRYTQGLYRRNLLPWFFSKKKKLQILNVLRCESHKDIAERIFYE